MAMNESEMESFEKVYRKAAQCSIHSASPALGWW